MSAASTLSLIGPSAPWVRATPGNVGCRAMAIGIITGTGTYALCPALRRRSPQPAATRLGKSVCLAGATCRRPRCCTSPATARDTSVSRIAVAHNRNEVSTERSWEPLVPRRDRVRRGRPVGAAGTADRGSTICTSSSTGSRMGRNLHAVRHARRPSARPLDLRGAVLRSGCVSFSRGHCRTVERCRLATAAATATSTARVSIPARRSALARALAGVRRCRRPPGPETVLCGGGSSCPYALLGYATDYANGVQDEPTPVADADRDDGREHGDVRAPCSPRAVPRAEAADLAPAGDRLPLQRLTTRTVVDARPEIRRSAVAERAPACRKPPSARGTPS